MERDAALVVTEAQWIEHSDAWRWGHLDQAPSVALRRKAIEEHEHQERILHAPQDHRRWGLHPLRGRVHVGPGRQ